MASQGGIGKARSTPLAHGILNLWHCYLYSGSFQSSPLVPESTKWGSHLKTLRIIRIEHYWVASRPWTSIWIMKIPYNNFLWYGDHSKDMKGLGNILEFVIQYLSTSIINRDSLINILCAGLTSYCTCLRLCLKN